MHARQWIPGAWRSWLALCLASLLVAAGCNPGLISALGGDTSTALTPPSGYIMVLLMNRSLLSVKATFDVVKENRTTKRWDISTGAVNWFALLQDCDTAIVQFQQFTDGTTTTPANLGPIQKGNGMQCGQVIAVTADGNPPTFTVEVF
jgi:hypothetical protein